MNVFDIIGPVMIGPSSSHTAGAVRIGHVGRMLLGEEVVKADIDFCQSFAQTGRGHGTDKAIVAGLLGMFPDDERIRDSFRYAKEAGLEFSITEIRIARAHPNTAQLHLRGKTGKVCALLGASVGGGNILITQVNDMETAFTGASDTLIISNQDVTGVIAEVASILSWHGINIGNFRVNRPHKDFAAAMTVEIDGTRGVEFVEALRALPHVNSVVYLRAIQEGT